MSLIIDLNVGKAKMPTF